jgi:hypothetical protein
MAIRNVPAGTGPMVPVDERLSVVRAEGDERDRVLDELRAAGFEVVGPADLPAPAPVEGATFERTLSTARLGVEAAIAFLDAAAADRRRVDERIVTSRSELDQVRRRIEGLGDLHDLLIEELGRGPVPIDALGTGWALIAQQADRCDLAGLAAGVRAWLGAAQAGTAPRHEVHPHCYDLPAVLDGAPTRVATEASVATQRLGEVQAALDQLALERAELDDEIDALAADLDAATRSAATAAEHVERWGRRRAQAGEVVERVLTSRGPDGVVVDAELEWLSADELLDALEQAAARRPVVLLALREDLPAERVPVLRPSGRDRSRRERT